MFIALFLFYGEDMSVYAESMLNNGLRVVYAKVPGVKVVSVQAWIKTGSVNEKPETSGISHFLEHILFKGSKNFKPGEIDSYLDSKGGSNNAFTSLDVTDYYVTIPEKEAEAAFKVVSDMVFNALFIPDEIEKEKPVVIQEINGKYNNPYYEMLRDFNETLFKGTPYAMPIIGTPETVNSFTAQQLEEYYRNFYHPCNMVLVVVGDIDKDKALDLAEKYFSQKVDVPFKKGYQGGNRVVLEEPVHRVFFVDANVEYCMIGCPTDGHDTRKGYTEEVLTEILSGGEYSLLNQELKINNNIANYVSCVSYINKFHGCFGAYGVIENGKGEIFKDKAVEILQNVGNGNFDSSGVEKAKNRLRSDAVFQAEKVSSVANNIGFACVFNNMEYFINYQKGIDAVTFDDVCSMAKDFFNGNIYFGETIPKNKK